MVNIPSKSLVTTPRGAGMVHQDGLNNAQPYNNEGYNTFDRSNVHQITQRFADIRPYNMQIPVDGDVVRNRNVFDLSTFTMKSRLLTRVRQHLSAISVPFSAILPNTWDIVLKQPEHGEDIPDDAFPNWNLTFFVSDFLIWANEVDFDSLSHVEQTYLVLALNGLFGHDSLLRYLGYSVPFADEIDDLYSTLVDGLIGDNIVYTSADGVDYTLKSAALSPLMDLLERVWRGELTLKTVSSSVTSGDFDNVFVAMQDMINGDAGVLRTIYMPPVFAYQMSCAQYFVNSHIDDIYTAKLWLQNLLASYDPATFTVNGVHYVYDACSSNFLDDHLNFYQSGDDITTWFKLCSNLFAFRSSLRVPDYFVESRLRPLSPADLNVAVNDGYVNVVDITSKQWLQRLANAVNRSNSEINQYLYNMTGIQRQSIDPQPHFIVSETFDVHQQETENTGSAQVSDVDSVTSRLSRTESKYMFEIQTDEPETVVLWLQSFSAQYTYPNAIDKVFDAQNRFDFFNSFLQHVGDQNVHTHELDAGAPYGEVFGFQLRFAQYKNSLSIACGGFSRGVLDTWALMWPKWHDADSEVVVTDKLDSTFIRNHNGEFDKFYNSLTGKDPASRFHFICQFYNITANNSKQQAYPTLA